MDRRECWLYKVMIIILRGTNMHTVGLGCKTAVEHLSSISESLDFIPHIVKMLGHKDASPHFTCRQEAGVSLKTGPTGNRLLG